MFCKTCGKEVHDNAVICPYCGCALKEMPTQTINVTNVTHQEKRTSLLGVLGFILALVSWFYDPFFAFSIIGFVLSLLGAIISSITRKTKKGLAVAGIVLIIIKLVIIFIFVAFFGASIGQFLAVLKNLFTK